MRPVRDACFALLAGLALWPAHAPAAGDFAHDPLRGVAAVTFAIDGVDPDVAAYGLRRDELFAAMSGRLQQAGIAVLPEQDAAARPDAAALTLRVRLVRAPYYFYLYSVKLALHGKVPLAQNAGAYAAVETWSDGDIGAIQPNDLTPIRALSLRLLDRFIAERARQN